MPKKSQLKIPPQNLEAEQAVLGSLLIDKNAIFRVADLLVASDFYFPAHEKIFEAIISLYEKRQPIDVMSLGNFLKEKELLKDIGGSSYLAELTNQVSTASHVEHYANIVKEKKTRRDLIQASAEITETVFEPQEIGDMLDTIEQKILAISQKSLPQNFTALKDELTGAYERIAKLHEGGDKLRGISTGFASLDNKLSGFQKSDLILLGARPSSGKTSLALDIGRQAALAGHSVGIFSLEMSREQVIDRIISAESQVPLWHILTGRIADETEFMMIQGALDRLSSAKLYIDDSPSLNILQMRSMARRLQVEHGLDMLIVDYLQLIRPRTTSDNVVNQITEISRGLKALARELKVPVFALSQLSRNVEQRDHKTPRLSDLRDSGCLAGETLIMRADTGELVTIQSLAERTDQQVPVPVYALNEKMEVVVQPLVKAFSSGRKQIFEMKLRSGRSIKASANHPFRVLTGWQALENLRVGDHLATPAKLEATAAKNEMSDYELILLAHLLGDGCILPNRPYHYTSADDKNIDIVTQAARILFDIKPRIVHQENWWHVYLPSPHHLTHHTHHPITEWFEQLGIERVRSYDKKIPQAVFAASDEKIALFLHHLWSTDGNISWKLLPGRKPAGQIYYSSTSKKLVEQMQHLLLRLGIQSKLTSTQKGDYRLNHNVLIQGSTEQLKFLRVIGSFGQRGEIVPELIAALEEIVPNTNLNVLPREAWQFLIEPAKVAAGMSWRDVSASIGVAYNGTAIQRNGIGRERLLRLANALQSKTLEQYAGTDLYWDEIVSITPLGVEEVYDATVDGAHNFVANDIIVHNSLEQDSDIVMFIYRKEADSIDANSTSNITQILIAKHRNGPVGEIELTFDKERASFKSIDKRYQDAALPPL